jgi:hypothetical protein
MKMLVFPSAQTEVPVPKKNVHKDIIFKLILSRDTKPMRNKNIPRFFLQTRSLEKSRLYFARNGLCTKDKRTKTTVYLTIPVDCIPNPVEEQKPVNFTQNDNINLVFLVF